MREAETIIIGGGMAGLSAAIYIARACREVLIIDSGHSMAKWEPAVENFLGFPDGISGEELLMRGRQQVDRFGGEIIRDEIIGAYHEERSFELEGQHESYRSPQ